MKRALCVMLGILIMAGILPTAPVNAATKDKVSIKTFVKALEEASGSGNLLKEGEYTNTSAWVTWADAAVLTNRADEAKNGTGYSESLYQQVKEKKRLTGISKLTKEQKEAVMKCFVKGIMPGDSNGTYSQSRKFRAGDYVTKAEMKKIIARLKEKTKRIKLSPDGQVLRITNLPKNYKSFNYILASFPNEFYEKKFMYQRTKYGRKPENLVDYASPKNFTKVSWTGMNGKESNKELFEEYGDAWCELVRKNLEYRLNFDYRTVDNDWVSGLRDTYYVYENHADLNKPTTDRIKKYVKAAKKNHVVVEAARIVVEPSTMYYQLGGGNFVRCYIKFRVTAESIYTRESQQQSELIFSDMESIGFYGLKNGQWYEAVCDVSIEGQWGDTGADYKMNWDSLGRKAA